LVSVLEPPIGASDSVLAEKVTSGVIVDRSVVESLGMVLDSVLVEEFGSIVERFVLENIGILVDTVLAEGGRPSIIRPVRREVWSTIWYLKHTKYRKVTKGRSLRWD
jgi:hypothetical protein